MKYIISILIAVTSVLATPIPAQKTQGAAATIVPLAEPRDFPLINPKRAEDVPNVKRQESQPEEVKILFSSRDKIEQYELRNKREYLKHMEI